MKHIFEQYPKVFLCLLLAAVTGLACLPMGDFSFINYDDNIYVYEKQHVQQGLTGNRQPLTWLSRMLDNTLFGAGAGGYHLVNFRLHLLNTLPLFMVLNMMTGSGWTLRFRRPACSGC